MVLPRCRITTARRSPRCSGCRSTGFTCTKGMSAAASAFAASFVRERLVDVIADRLGLDPVVVRRRNFIAKTAMPFRREFSALGTDIVYDTGDYAGLLDKFLNRVEWERLRADVGRRRQAGE